MGRNGPPCDCLIFFENKGNGRNELIIEPQTTTAFRKDNWALIPPYNGPKIKVNVNIESGNSSFYQLYNLETDISQPNNLALKNPKKLKDMIRSYEAILLN